MKLSKRIISALLVLVMVVSVLPSITFSTTVKAVSPEKGMTFSADCLYEMSDIKRPSSSITIESEIWIPYDAPDDVRMGVIIGNYEDDVTGDYAVEIHKNGVVRLYSKTADIFFTDVDIREYMGTANEPLFAKIAVVADTQLHEAILYVNGQEVTRVANERLVDGFFASSESFLCVGGERRNGNGQYFKGEMKNLTFYADVRTPEELSASANAKDYSAAFNVDDEALLAAFDLTAKNALDDLSSADRDLVFTSPYGMSFNLNHEELMTMYLNKKLTELPRTYEIEFYAPYETRDGNGRPGVLFGNWSNKNELKETELQPSLTLEIHNNGMPKICMINDKGATNMLDVNFSGVDVRRGGWVHMVIVNEGNEYRCYIDGVLVKTVIDSKGFEADIEAMQSVNRLMFGTDTRPATKTFEGIVRNMALYSEPLTEEEIKDSYENGIDSTNDSLMLYYDLENARGKISAIDLSGNGYSASPEFYARDYELEEYAYSFAVVGDTQRQVWADYQSRVDDDLTNDTYYTEKIYKWIVDNKEKKNIQWVFGMGDITEHNGITGGSSEYEWELAKEAIVQLDEAGMDYSVILGNHDMVGDPYFGDTTYFNKYFGEESGDFYTKRVSGYYEDGKLDNYYMNFEVSGIKYMMLALEYGPNDGILEWASDVVQAHPDRQIIVTTHAYMYRDGTTIDKDSVACPNGSGEITKPTSRNNGDMMWDKFVSQHKNILMVLSGHDPCSDIVFRQDRGIHGNIVSQFLIDPQGMATEFGMVCMLYFSEDGRKVSVEWISTGKTQAAQEADANAEDILYKATNQFDFITTAPNYADLYVQKGLSFFWSGEGNNLGRQDAVAATVVDERNGLSITRATDGRQMTEYFPGKNATFYEIDKGVLFEGNYGKLILNDLIPTRILENGKKALADMTIEVSQSYPDYYKTSTNGASKQNLRGNDGGFNYFGLATYTKSVTNGICVNGVWYAPFTYTNPINKNDVRTVYVPSTAKTDFSYYAYDEVTGTMTALGNLTYNADAAQNTASALSAPSYSKNGAANSFVKLLPFDSYGYGVLMRWENNKNTTLDLSAYDDYEKPQFMNAGANQVYTTTMFFDSGYDETDLTSDSYNYRLGISRDGQILSDNVSSGTYSDKTDYSLKDSDDDASNFAFTYGVSTSAVCYYSIRIYDRILSSEEQAQNHFIDIAYQLNIDLLDYAIADTDRKLLVHELTVGKSVTDFSDENLQMQIDMILAGGEESKEILKSDALEFDGYSIRLHGDPGLRAVFTLDTDFIEMTKTNDDAVITEIGAIVAIKGAYDIEDLTINGGQTMSVNAVYQADMGYAKDPQTGNEKIFTKTANGKTVTCFALTTIFDSDSSKTAESYRTELIYRGYMVVTVGGKEFVIYTDMSAPSFEKISMYDVTKVFEANGYENTQTVKDVLAVCEPKA